MKRLLQQKGFVLHQNGPQKTSEILKTELLKLEKLRKHQDFVDHAKLEKRSEVVKSPMRNTTPQLQKQDDEFWNALYTDESVLLFEDDFPGEYLVVRKEGILVGTLAFNRLVERNKYRLGNIYYILNMIYSILGDFDIRMAQIKCARLEELADQLVYSSVTMQNLYSCFTKPQVFTTSTLVL